MKIERLIGIIIILLQNKKVTATWLADRFHVSRRTIYRDITDLSLAGIPVTTSAGTDGGIRIDEDYKLDKTLFTEKELQAVFTGLLSMDSVASGHQYQAIMEKFLSGNNRYTQTPFLINLSSHYKDSLAPKIAEIQQAIEEAHPVVFDYYNRQGERRIVIEPYFIVFQWSSWYVFGCDWPDGGAPDGDSLCGNVSGGDRARECHEESNFRLYKLNRLWNLRTLSETFAFREIPQDRLDFNRYFTDGIHAVIHFDQSVKHRLIEEYGTDCFAPMEDGTLCFTFPFTNKEYLLEWVLSFGDKAELKEPREYRAEIKSRLAHSLGKYSESSQC